MIIIQYPLYIMKTIISADSIAKYIKCESTCNDRWERYHVKDLMFQRGKVDHFADYFITKPYSGAQRSLDSLLFHCLYILICPINTSISIILYHMQSRGFKMYDHVLGESDSRIMLPSYTEMHTGSRK